MFEGQTENEIMIKKIVELTVHTTDRISQKLLVIEEFSSCPSRRNPRLFVYFSVLDVPYYTQNKRGRPMLVFGVHTFTRERETGAKSEWRCRKRTTAGCKANVIIIDGEIVRSNHEHNHE